MDTWNIKQLRAAMDQDLLSCHTALERSMVRTLGGKEIVGLAQYLSTIRSLTPGEIAIAQEFGYKA